MLIPSAYRIPNRAPIAKILCPQQKFEGGMTLSRSGILPIRIDCKYLDENLSCICVLLCVTPISELGREELVLFQACATYGFLQCSLSTKLNQCRTVGHDFVRRRNQCQRKEVSYSHETRDSTSSKEKIPHAPLLRHPLQH